MEARLPMSDPDRIIVHGRLAWTDELKDKVAELFLDGKSMGQIGIELNITRSTVAGIIGRLRKSNKYDLTQRREQKGGRRAKNPQKVTKPVCKKDPITLSFQRKQVEQATKKKHRLRLRLVEKTEVTLEELKPWMCKWPIGDPKRPDYRYCGRERVADDNCPYCAEHTELAYVTPRKRYI